MKCFKEPSMIYLIKSQGYYIHIHRKFVFSPVRSTCEGDIVFALPFVIWNTLKGTMGATPEVRVLDLLLGYVN